MTAQQGNLRMTKEPPELRDFFAKVNSSGVEYTIVCCIPVDNLRVKARF